MNALFVLRLCGHYFHYLTKCNVTKGAKGVDEPNHGYSNSNSNGKDILPEDYNNWLRTK